MIQGQLSNSGSYYQINEFREHRTTLVFIHGLTGSASSWRDYENSLETDYNILTIDLRGHGKSKKFKHFSDYEIQNFAGDIYGIISFLGIQKCSLISHSFGTLVALQFLIEHQNIVEQTIFLSPNYEVNKTAVGTLTKPLLKWVVRGINLLPSFKKNGGHIDYSKYHNPGDWDIGLNIADIHNTGLRVYLFCLEQIYEANYDGEWELITIPTLIIHGANDSLVPLKNALALAQKMPRAKIIVLENAKHLFVLNNIPQTLAIMENFLAGH